jgi:hypothetical protein
MILCDCSPVGHQADERLMVQGEVGLTGGEAPLFLQRGMMICSSNSGHLGTLAALVFDCAAQKINQLLLCQLPLSAEYHRVPLAKIAGIQDDIIHLTIPQNDIQTLARYQSV